VLMPAAALPMVVVVVLHIALPAIEFIVAAVI